MEETLMPNHPFNPGGGCCELPKEDGIHSPAYASSAAPEAQGADYCQCTRPYEGARPAGTPRVCERCKKLIRVAAHPPAVPDLHDLAHELARYLAKEYHWPDERRWNAEELLRKALAEFFTRQDSPQASATE